MALLSLAAATSARASSIVWQAVTSLRTCLPALSAATACSAWNGTGEATTTASMSLLRNASKSVNARAPISAGRGPDLRRVDVVERSHRRALRRLADTDEALPAPQPNHPESDLSRFVTPCRSRTDVSIP